MAKPVTTLERRFQKVWETLNDLCIRVYKLEQEFEHESAILRVKANERPNRPKAKRK